MSLDIGSLNTDSLLGQNSSNKDSINFNQDENSLLSDFIKENGYSNEYSINKQTVNSDVKNNIIELSEYKRSLLNFVIDQNNKIMELIKQ